MSLKVGNWYWIKHDENYYEGGSTLKTLEIGSHYYAELRYYRSYPSYTNTKASNLLVVRTLEDKFIMYKSNNELLNIDIKQANRDELIIDILS